MTKQRIECHSSGVREQTTSAAIATCSSLKGLFMAIFIFRVGSPFYSVGQKLAVVFSAVVLTSGIPAMGAGYMISAKDRAQATALSQQAYVTFQSGDYDQALGLLAQSDQLKPDQPDGWNLRGVIYLKQKA